MRSTYLVAVVALERDVAINRILALDGQALIGRETNPCAFIVRTTISTFAIDAISGVAHVFELDENGKVSDTFGPALTLQRKRDEVRKSGDVVALLRLDQSIADELNRLRSLGKLGPKQEEA